MIATARVLSAPALLAGLVLTPLAASVPSALGETIDVTALGAASYECP